MYCFIQDYLVNTRIKMINLNARKPHENMLAYACSFLRGWIVSSWALVHPSSWAQIAVDQSMKRRHHPPCESRSICALALLSAMEIKWGDLDLPELQKDVCSSTKSNPLCGTKPKRSFWYRFLLPCPSPAKGNPLFFCSVGIINLAPLPFQISLQHLKKQFHRGHGGSWFAGKLVVKSPINQF